MNKMDENETKVKETIRFKVNINVFVKKQQQQIGLRRSLN